MPWLEAMSGCGVRYAAGSLAPEACAGTIGELAERALPANRGWYDRLDELTQEISAGLPDDCFASPTILRGPSDVLAAARGLTNFYLDLYDEPAAVAAAAANVNRLFASVIERHFQLVPTKLGGYGHIFGYWAPDRLTCSRKMCWACAIRVHLPRNLHAPELRPGAAARSIHAVSPALDRATPLAGRARDPRSCRLQITVEANGPRLADLAPVLRTILERSRLMLFVDAWFDDLYDVLRQIPHDGLYLMISDRFIGNEAEYQEFSTANFGGEGRDEVTMKALVLAEYNRLEYMDVAAPTIGQKRS